MHNPHPIDEAFLSIFAENTKEAGLHNLVAENALVIGIQHKYIQATSLQSIKLGQFDNQVQWTKEACKERVTMLLYNSNHSAAVRATKALKDLMSWFPCEQDGQDRPTELEEFLKTIVVTTVAKVKKVSPDKLAVSRSKDGAASEYIYIALE